MKDELPFQKYLKNLGGRKTVLLLAVLGILLLAFGGGMAKSGAEKEQDPNEAYLLRLTEELTVLCREVKGVGEVRVMVTLSEGEHRDYSGSRLLSTRMPQVEGVAVVCTGGGDPTVRGELIGLLTSLLGIGSHRVHISQKQI